MTTFQSIPETVAAWLTTPQFGLQAGAIVISIILAYGGSRLIRSSADVFRQPPPDKARSRLRLILFRCRSLIAPVLLLFFTGIAVRLADNNVDQSWLIRMARSVAFINLLFAFTTTFMPRGMIRNLVLWIGIPIALLHVFGLLDNVTRYLDTVSLSVGEIRISLFVLARTFIFGALLFWLGRESNKLGKQAIRRQESLDLGTREVLVKLFEIALYVIVFLLLLQVMGINLTALAVFGGALGVGLGFGLQQIASNFISGLIILLDRSVQIGDFIELEDGRSGRLRDLNMRQGVIETFDGKDVMIPNERFITSSYTNWTHKDPKQRYPLNFQVAYSTDLDLLFDNIRTICSEHPKVISGNDVPIAMRPDAEIAGFGDSGIDILVEFWIEGIDDGENRVGADLMHSIWRSIQEHGMEIPFPQREVRILNDWDLSRGSSKS
ncbi:MAG: mechanosensitive ion channel [Gammaproteobacteria bacterium]|nr:mechanosensitive ion channel [Gammaproteobacteria bacterium]